MRFPVPSRPQKLLAAIRPVAEIKAQALPPLITAAEQAVAAMLSGEHQQRKAGAGEDFWQFREYNASDRPQDIDWRQSAKGERVFIRQKEWQNAQTTFFWCQNTPGMRYSSNKRYRDKHHEAVILSLALSILLRRGGETVRPLSPARQESSRDAIETLGQYFIAEETAALPVTGIEDLPRHASVILAGDFLNPLAGTRDFLSRFAGQAANSLVLQVLDPAELTLPFTGRAIFTLPGEEGESYAVEHIDGVRAAYQERFARHQEGLAEICRRQHFKFLSHATSTNIIKTLHAAWNALSLHNASPAGTFSRDAQPHGPAQEGG